MPKRGQNAGDLFAGGRPSAKQGSALNETNVLAAGPASIKAPGINLDKLDAKGKGFRNEVTDGTN
jgi:hypothetical protein